MKRELGRVRPVRVEQSTMSIQIPVSIRRAMEGANLGFQITVTDEGMLLKAVPLPEGDQPLPGDEVPGWAEGK